MRWKGLSQFLAHVTGVMWTCTLTENNHSFHASKCSLPTHMHISMFWKIFSCGGIRWHLNLTISKINRVLVLLQVGELCRSRGLRPWPPILGQLPEISDVSTPPPPPYKARCSCCLVKDTCWTRGGWPRTASPCTLVEGSEASKATAQHVRYTSLTVVQEGALLWKSSLRRSLLWWLWKVADLLPSMAGVCASHSFQVRTNSPNDFEGP